MCKSNNSVKTFVMVASIFLITMLAFDRYWSLSKIRVSLYYIYYILFIFLNKFIVTEPWEKIPALYRFNLDTVGAGFLSAIFKIEIRRRNNWEPILSCRMG